MRPRRRGEPIRASTRLAAAAVIVASLLVTAALPAPAISVVADGWSRVRWSTTPFPALVPSAPEAGPPSAAGVLVRTVSVAVEAGLPESADGVTREVGAVLADPRSWVGIMPMRWQLVGTGPTGERPDADLEVLVASPATVDQLCAPLRTVGRLSCRQGDRVILNVDRWRNGPDVYHDGFDGHLDDYRAYLVNHEVGHWLGRGHRNISCGSADVLAPVMMQQTFGLRGCAPNGWPVDDGRRLADATPPPAATPLPLSPPPPSGPCDAASVLPWGVDDRPLDDEITRLYAAAFGRAADRGGLAHWREQRAGGTSHLAVARAMLGTEEAQRTVPSEPDALVTHLYATVLARSPDAGGVAFWRARLDAGAAPADLLVAFADSPENVARTATSPPQPAATGWLIRLYRTALGRHPGCEGVRYWRWWLDLGVGRTEVVDRLLASPEHRSLTADLDDGAFVDRLYRTALGRDPDPAGRAAWVDALATGRLDRAVLVAIWLDAPEFVIATGTTPTD